MLNAVIKYFQDKSTLISKVEQLEHENDALALEVFNLEKELEEAYASIRRRTASINSLQLLLVNKNVDIAVIKEESRKLFYHTTELLQNTHLTPAGELEEVLSMVERLTRATPGSVVELKKITRSDQDANA